MADFSHCKIRNHTNMGYLPPMSAPDCQRQVNPVKMCGLTHGIWLTTPRISGKLLPREIRFGRVHLQRVRESQNR